MLEKACQKVNTADVTYPVSCMSNRSSAPACWNGMKWVRFKRFQGTKNQKFPESQPHNILILTINAIAKHKNYKIIQPQESMYSHLV